MDYNIQYFIDKFEAIPEENWCTGTLKDGNRLCAFGHCNMEILDMPHILSNPEARALLSIFTEKTDSDA